jgi:hypothetical protein
MQVKSSPKLRLSISFPKEIYKLGEPISPVFELANNGNDTITVWDSFNVASSSIQVLATQNDKTKPIEFGNSKWGTVDCICRIFIAPNQMVKSTTGILWYDDTKGLPAFRVTESGDYYFKIRYMAFLEEGNPKNSINLESEPIKITIEEPKGEDLEVWNLIKNNGNFAYFIQEGNIPESIYQPEERAKFQAEVEQILTDYPNSFYATSLSQSLAKFKASEAKRCELMEKMKPKPQ